MDLVELTQTDAAFAQAKWHRRRTEVVRAVLVPSPYRMLRVKKEVTHADRSCLPHH